MHLDLGTILNLISTLTLIGALVFTGLQLRASNRMRREQAAIAMRITERRANGRSQPAYLRQDGND